MDIRDNQKTVGDAINDIRNRGLYIEVIQFRGDVWDAVIKESESLGVHVPENPEFAGCRVERKEMKPYTTFRIVTKPSDTCGMAFHEVVTNNSDKFVYSVLSPIKAGAE
ncbi:hypothetical protein ACWNPK_20895 [Bacillus atrophaeus]